MQRKKENILLDDLGDPIGGEWNYDKENRKPPKKGLKPPHPKAFKPDAITQDVLKLVQKKFKSHFGNIEPFWFAVTQKQARQSLAHFIRHSLPNFGTYQDAMVEGEPFLFHSVLSQYLNLGLLTAKEICHAVEKAFHKKDVPINSAEGYIRQILGWREFVRGIYWTYMPKYKEKNALEASRPLPEFYWNGKTEMICMRCVIKQTESEAHSHHIQRLMVTGNFALLAGIDPKQVCDWYLAVYADAFDWVELPNTLGMSLFGDGGIVGTKPYAASGAYIHRMSNFCQGCKYNVNKKVGDSACPFNFFYWNFLITHEKKFRKNPRMKLINRPRNFCLTQTIHSRVYPLKRDRVI